jgi:hypothetical protein
MKKILFISKYLSTRQNGFETRLACLIKYFKKNNYHVLAITSSFSLKKKIFKKKYTKKKLDGVNYIFIKENSNYSLYSFQRAFSWIKFEINLFKLNYNKLGFVPDIIYVSSLSLLTILNGIILKKKYKAKLVFEMRDFWPYFLYKSEQYSKYNPLVLILSYIEKIGIKNSDLIISLIPRIKKYLNYRGFKNKKTFSSTFPIEVHNFKKQKVKKMRKSFAYNICYAGNFGFDNYLYDLLSLISLSNQRNNIYHFIGDGSQKKKLIQKYSSLKNVFFYDSVNYKSLHSILIQMNLLILSFGFNNKYPSYGYELNKLNNYLMASKPILAIGNKNNLLPNRGKFFFVEKYCPTTFDNTIQYIQKNYKKIKEITKFNKFNLMKRNDPNVIFNQTLKKIKAL